MKIKRENRRAGKEYFKVCDLGNATTLMKSRNGEVEMNVIGIKKGLLLQRSSSYIF